MKRVLVGLVLLLVILSACGGKSTIAPPATDTLQPVSITTQTGNFAFMTKRVATIHALQTASLTPYPASLLPLPSTLTPNQTMEARRTLDAIFGSQCGHLTSYPYPTSPDGTWILCGNKVVNINGRQWLLEYKNLFETQVDVDELFNLYGIASIHWSIDGRYLYFPIMPAGEMNPPYFINATSLLRMDLEDGIITKVLDGNIDPTLGEITFYAYSLSPSGDQLAYVLLGQNPPLSVIVRDIRTDNNITVPIDQKYNQAGNFVWSPDEAKLAFILYQDEAGEEKLPTSTTVIMDLSTNRSIKPLLLSTFNYHISNWTYDDILIFEFTYGDYYGHDDFDLKTKRFINSPSLLYTILDKN